MKKRANKNMATGSGFYTSAHNGYSKQIAWMFETANRRPAVYILMTKAVILNTYRILSTFLQNSE